MKKQNKIILAVAAFCVVVIALFAVWKLTRPEPQAGSKQVTVEVVHGDGETTEFTYQTDLEYLGELLKEEELISGTESEYGMFVDTVDGETADYYADGSWWALYCNGEMSELGVDSVVIQDGDTYTWTYTIG